MSVGLLNICVMATLSISSFLIVWLRYAAGGMSVTQPGIELAPSELEVQDLNHWTTRDISSVFLLHGRKSLDAFTLFCNT